MRELDVLLLGYLEQQFPSAASDERDAFRQLLELPDPEIFGYLVGRAVPSGPAMRNVIASILRHKT